MRIDVATFVSLTAALAACDQPPRPPATRTPLTSESKPASKPTPDPESTPIEERRRRPDFVAERGRQHRKRRQSRRLQSSEPRLRTKRPSKKAIQRKRGAREIHLEYRKGGSQKYWAIEVKGSTHTVHFGRIGTSGQTKTKPFDSPEAARRDADKLIAEKRKRGYS